MTSYLLRKAIFSKQVILLIQNTMKILLIDSSSSFKEKLKSEWSLKNTQFESVHQNTDLFNLIEKEPSINIVFLSIHDINIDNLDIITYIQEKSPHIQVFILTTPKKIKQAESCVQRGAHSYFLLPIETKTLEQECYKRSNQILVQQEHRLWEEQWIHDLLGKTPVMDKILSVIEKVAPTDSSILIQGESGTGKEFIAQLIHRQSKRNKKPFITINCGSIPENLIESELFGVKKGAFTGALNDKKGLFEEADNGTLFLDEIGEIPKHLQVKLLRFLQNKEIRRLGETEIKTLNVRIIAATNVNLKEAVKKNEFREDLFYRLNIFNFDLPPLRERKINLPHLILFFVKKHQNKNPLLIQGLSKEVESILTEYNYPGNVRELENIIEHAIILCDGTHILKKHLPEDLIQGLSLPQLPSNLNSIEINNKQHFITLQELERKYIHNVLKTYPNQTKAAKILGISRPTLWRKIKSYNLQ